MDSWQNIARLLGVTGIFLLVMSGVIWVMGKHQLNWRLPGDIFFQKGNFIVAFPLATSILVSILLTIIVNLVWRR